ncbi:MAG: type VI secretion system baseplate subunit TssG [Acidobacteriaceae bacterium]|nr:type VI secretion system baseplate subunit TssG [Acidobacteriaceae bacterium]MBV9296411.1 type VI secretion system baseplate subunit TssG [Acidobacteriaceae bacterium]MBV9764377.1 type VI secretion system baseplate subunit TssG [Acidobacteriaceae bacterium]
MSPDTVRRTSFFSLVEAIERFCQPQATVGQLGPPQYEVLRFRVDPSFAFPVCDVLSLEPPQDGEAQWPYYTVTTTFLSLLGSGSPLPDLYTQEIVHDPERGEAKRAFFDLFHHRLISLFYRVWRKYRYAFTFREDCKDPYSLRFLLLTGADPESIFGQTAVDATVFLRYLPVFYRKPRSASALAPLLRDFLGGINVAVVQFIPRKVQFESWQHSAIGAQNNCVGRNMLIGAKATSLNAGFRVLIGPLTYERYVGYLPEEQGMRQVVQLTTWFTTDRLDFDLEFQVEYQSVPLFWLGQASAEHHYARLYKLKCSLLGRTTWLRNPERPPHTGQISSIIMPTSPTSSTTMAA